MFNCVFVGFNRLKRFCVAFSFLYKNSKALSPLLQPSCFFSKPPSAARGLSAATRCAGSLCGGRGCKKLKDSQLLHDRLVPRWRFDQRIFEFLTWLRVDELEQVPVPKRCGGPALVISHAKRLQIRAGETAGSRLPVLWSGGSPDFFWGASVTVRHRPSPHITDPSPPSPLSTPSLLYPNGHWAGPQSQGTSLAGRGLCSGTVAQRS